MQKQKNKPMVQNTEFTETISCTHEKLLCDKDGTINQ